MGIYDDLANLSSPSPTGPAHPQETHPETATREGTPKVTRKSTRPSTTSRDNPRHVTRKPSREKSRESARTLPTRDEIQEFSFRLRDELRVKVQAEVPPAWQEELEEVARELRVKKMELYRFIIGEFLGKVKRKGT